MRTTSVFFVGFSLAHLCCSRAGEGDLSELATSGCSHRMGPNHSWTASQKREVAVGAIKGARDTEPRMEVETSCPGPRPVASHLNPDEALTVAKARVGWLETGLVVLAESDSAEAHALRQVLQQVRCSAQEQPINVQIKDTENFIVRSTNRLPPSLGHGRLWPELTLAKPTLASVRVFVCLCVLVSRCPCGVSRFWFGHVRCPRDRPSRDRPPHTLEDT